VASVSLIGIRHTETVSTTTIIQIHRTPSTPFNGSLFTMCKIREIPRTVSRILYVFDPALPHFTQTLYALVCRRYFSHIIPRENINIASADLSWTEQQNFCFVHNVCVNFRYKNIKIPLERPNVYTGNYGDVRLISF